MSSADIAWHCTIGDHLSAIRRTGRVRPATAGVPRGEQPAIWFSTLDTYEPTARKLFATPTGEVRLATDEEHERFGGFVRIGFATSAPLRRWDDDARRAIGQAVETWRRLEESALRQGSDPTKWWICPHALSLKKAVSIQRFQAGAWTSLPLPRGRQ